MMIDAMTQQFILSHADDDVRLLALQAARWPGVDMPAALQQIAGHQVAREKVPQWAAIDGILYPPHLSLEQCSSQATALYKAALAEGDALCDLTGGMGVDFAFMARDRKRATYVERQPHLCELAQHNLPLLGLPQAQVVCADAQEHLTQMDEVDTIYIDPARRGDAGQRVYALADCTPDVAALAPTLLQRARQVIIKLSPMLDVQQALRQLPCVEQVHIVGVRGECKELLVVLRRGHEGDVAVHCVTDDRRFSYTLGEERCGITVWDETVPEGGLWLCEANATIMKAGGHDLLARRLGLQVMSRDSHLMVSDHPVEAFPGRVFKVQAVTTMNKRELKAAMQGITHANVAVRNFPLRAPELARRLKVKDGGIHYIFGTTTATGKHIVIISEHTPQRTSKTIINNQELKNSRN